MKSLKRGFFLYLYTCLYTTDTAGLIFGIGIILFVQWNDVEDGGPVMH